MQCGNLVFLCKTAGIGCGQDGGFKRLYVELESACICLKQFLAILYRSGSKNLKLAVLGVPAHHVNAHHALYVTYGSVL